MRSGRIGGNDSPIRERVSCILRKSSGFNGSHRILDVVIRLVSRVSVAARRNLPIIWTSAGTGWPVISTAKPVYLLQMASMYLCSKFRARRAQVRRRHAAWRFVEALISRWKRA